MRSITKYLELAEELKKHPHLKVPIKFDLERVQHELQAAAPKWMAWPSQLRSRPAETNPPPETFRQLNQTYYGSALFSDQETGEEHGLILEGNPYKISPYATEIEIRGHRFAIEQDGSDYSPDKLWEREIFMGMYEFLQYRWQHAKWTELGEKLPYLKSVLSPLSPDRVKIQLLKAGGRVPRHSDFQFCRSSRNLPYLFQKVHIPIFTNDQVEMANIDQTGVVHRQNYKEGEAWYYNVWNEHFVENNGPSDRLHLSLSFITLNNDAWFELASNALRSVQQ